MSDAGAGRPRVVLVGAGHAHLLVLARWCARQPPLDVSLVDPGPFRYSGMATGVLSGDYAAEDGSLDPAGLAAGAGARLLRERAVAVDRAARELRLASGVRLPYDRLSLNVGSVLREAPAGSAGARVYAAKPISELHRLAADLGRSQRPEAVLVAGAGVTGCEIALCVAARLRADQGQPRARVCLVHGGPEVARSLSPAGRRHLLRALEQAGVERVTQRRITSWTDDVARDDRGGEYPFSRLVLATGLTAAPLVHELGLPATGDGLEVSRTLASDRDRRVFAAGDCADVGRLGLPKVGVYGVRSAATLAHNLEAACRGERLREYRPQRRYLSIVNLGERRGLALWGPLACSGSLAWRWKDWIDRRFVRGLAAGAAAARRKK